jgi:hypothetical protein
MPLPLFPGLNVLIYAFCFATLTLAARNCEGAIPFAWVLAIGMLCARHRHAVQRIGTHWHHGCETALLPWRFHGLSLAAGGRYLDRSTGKPVICIFFSSPLWGFSPLKEESVA